MLLRSSISKTSVPPICVVGRDSRNSKARRKLGRIVFSSGSRRRTAANQTRSVPYTRQRWHPEILKLYYVRFCRTRKRRTRFASCKITIFSYEMISRRCLFLFLLLFSNATRFLFCTLEQTLFYFLFIFIFLPKIISKYNKYKYIYK